MQDATKVAQAMRNSGAAVGYAANDPLQPVYDNIIAQWFTGSGDSELISDAPSGEAMLRARHVLYWKNTAGDCGTPSKVSLGPAGTIQTGLGAAATTASAVGTIGGTSGAGLIGAAWAGPLALAVVPFAIWGIISGHHAAAVAREQGTLCDVCDYYNANFDAIVAANIDWAQKKALFDQVLQQSIAALQGISQHGPCNAGCVYQAFMNAVHDLYVKLYAQPPAANPLPGISSQPGAAETPTNATKTATSGPQSAILAGAGLISAHLMGFF